MYHSGGNQGLECPINSGLLNFMPVTQPTNIHHALTWIRAEGVIPSPGPAPPWMVEKPMKNGINHRSTDQLVQDFFHQ